MAYCNKRLILASGSPRRRELLDKFGIDYEILPAQGEESAPPELTPGERVKALAAQKAEEVAQRLNDPAAVILAADTLVELDGEVLGKPGTAERVQAMLRELSGREHGDRGIHRHRRTARQGGRLRLSGAGEPLRGAHRGRFLQRDGASCLPCGADAPRIRHFSSLIFLLAPGAVPGEQGVEP